MDLAEYHLKRLEASWHEPPPVELGRLIFERRQAIIAAREAIDTIKELRIARYRAAYEKLGIRLPRPLRRFIAGDHWNEDECAHCVVTQAMMGY